MGRTGGHRRKQAGGSQGGALSPLYKNLRGTQGSAAMRHLPCPYPGQHAPSNLSPKSLASCGFLIFILSHSFWNFLQFPTCCLYIQLISSSFSSVLLRLKKKRVCVHSLSLTRGSAFGQLCHPTNSLLGAGGLSEASLPGAPPGTRNTCY